MALEVADVLAVLQAEIRPTRMRCVTLPISVLAQALGVERSRVVPASGHPRSEPDSRTPLQ